MTKLLSKASAWRRKRALSGRQEGRGKVLHPVIEQAFLPHSGDTG